MKLYAVRVTETNDPVGIFCASSFDELVFMIDEYVVDPAVTEYKLLHGGGVIFWPHAENWPMGEPIPCEDLGDEVPDGVMDMNDVEDAAKRNCQFGGSISDVLFSSHKSTGWRKIGTNTYFRAVDRLYRKARQGKGTVQLGPDIRDVFAALHDSVDES